MTARDGYQMVYSFAQVMGIFTYDGEEMLRVAARRCLRLSRARPADKLPLIIYGRPTVLS